MSVIIKEDFDPKMPPQHWEEISSGSVIHPSTWDYKVGRMLDGPSLALSIPDESLANAAACIMPHTVKKFYNEFEFLVTKYPHGFLKVQTLYGPNGMMELSNIYLLGNGAGHRAHWFEFFGGNDGNSVNIEKVVPINTWVKIIRTYEVTDTLETPAIQKLRFELPDGHKSEEVSMVCRYYNPGDPNWMPGGVSSMFHFPYEDTTLKIRNMLVEEL